MKCKEYQDQLLDLSLGEDVSEDTIDQMIEHVLNCKKCLQYFRSFKFFDAQMKYHVEWEKKYPGSLREKLDKIRDSIEKSKKPKEA